MDTWDDKLFPMMGAVLGREITDDELETFQFVDDDEPESYLNCIRAERMLQECNARELQCFLNAGLLDVSGDSLSDPDNSMIKITLLEKVMPDVHKMEVAIAACPPADASDYITHKTALDSFQLAGCDDMLGRYLASGGDDARAVDLLLGTSEYNFIYDAHLACARSNGIHVRHPELFEHIESVMHSEDHWGECVQEVEFIRADHRSRRARARLGLLVCCSRLKILALRARERVFAPGGTGFLVLRQLAVERGMCV